jgi:hypothetical protein
MGNYQAKHETDCRALVAVPSGFLALPQERRGEERLVHRRAAATS